MTDLEPRYIAGSLSVPIAIQGAPLEAIPHVRWKNHPKPGVDYPCFFSHMVPAEEYRSVIGALAECIPNDVDAVAGIDSGLGLAGPVAFARGIGVIDIRKADTIRPSIIRSLMRNYAMGDGVVTPVGSVTRGRRIAVIDDCLMSGGTALASVQLVRRLGGICGQALFIFELEGMTGRSKLEREGLVVSSLQRLPQQGPAAPVS